MFRAGVLLNSGDAIERLAEVDIVIFDKTGTLTLPELDVVNAGQCSRGCVRARRPARALQPSSGRRRGGARLGSEIAAGRIVEEPGQGVRGFVDGVEVRLGRPSFCGAEGLANEILSRDPEVSVVAFRRGRQCYVFAVRQRLRPDALAVIAALQARGIAVEIALGRPRAGGAAAAGALGIDEWRAGVTPADKIARIEDAEAAGRKVMMVGDGMNDAPALAAAHVSMSPISATHLSQATADLVFLGKPLAPVVAAIDFSRKALHLMRQNLWLAVGYNLLAVPIAISGLVDAADRGRGDVRLVAAGDAERAARASRRAGETVMEVLVYSGAAGAWRLGWSACSGFCGR